MRETRLFVTGAADRGVITGCVIGPDGALRVAATSDELGQLLSLARHPDLPVLYAASAADRGTLHAFAIRDGTPILLGSTPSGGELPCSMAVDPSGRWLVTAHYGCGTLTVHELAEGGSVGPLLSRARHADEPAGAEPERQDGSHLHQVRFDPSGRWLIATDLGTDTIWTYQLSDGRLSACRRSAAASGAGPRHSGFATVGPACWLIVADELASTISWYELDREDGGLRLLGRRSSTVETGPRRNYPGDLQVSADSRFAYLANRGHDTLAVFAIGTDGLEPVQEVAAGGRWPQHLALVGARLYCALRDSDQITTFDVDRRTGEITLRTPRLVVPAPTWLTPFPERTPAS